jgi:hypothetical protein
LLPNLKYESRQGTCSWGLLPPHDAIVTTVKVPAGVTSFKFGLSFTSLTWRGDLAWRLLDVSFDCRPIIGFLLRQDEKTRSKTEWSEEYFAPPKHGAKDKNQVLQS